MKLKSKEFSAGCCRKTGRMETVKGFFGSSWEEEELEIVTNEQAKNEAADFASSIGKDRYDRITHTIQSNHVNGGLDGSWTNNYSIYTVWYWEDE